MGDRVPHLVSKMWAHLSKSQAQRAGLCEEWRRGNEIVDNLARGLAERARQERDLAALKAQFDSDVKLAKTSLLRLERSVAYRESTRAIWNLHAAKPKVLKGKRRGGTKHEPLLHSARGLWVCRACGLFSKEPAGFLKRREQVWVRRRGFWRESHPSHSLIRTEEVGSSIPVLLCCKRFC